MKPPVPYAEIFLAIAVIIIVARLTGWAFRKFHQPAVIGEIVAGLLLGLSALAYLPGNPSEHLFPADSQPFLKAIAALGLVLFMFIVGLELDLKVIRGQERLAISVSIASIVLPFIGGILLGYALYATHPPPDSTKSELVFGMFIGAAMAITAFPVLARILTDRGMLRTPLGSQALASAAVDDVIAWSLLAVVVAIAGPGAEGSSEPQWHIWLTIPYLVLMATVVRRMLGNVVSRYNDAGRLAPDLLAVLLAGLMLSSYATDWLGIHYIFGAFLFGAVMPRDGAAAMFHEILDRLELVSVLLLLPLFFVVTGLTVNFWDLGADWYWQLPAILGVAIGGKFIGAFVASRVQGVPRPRSAAIGVLMNTRGLTELVILSVGLQLGILDNQLYSMMVLMAVVTTIMTGPLLRVVYSDRRLARDIAEAEKAALGVPDAYRVIVATGGDPAADSVVTLARHLLADERPAELVLAQIRPLAVPTLEVGSGLSLELDEFVASAERLEQLRRELEASGTPSVSLDRMSADPVAELASMASDLEADVVVVDSASETQATIADRVVCQVVYVAQDPLRPAASIARVHLVMDDGRDADAAAEIALRVALGADAELLVSDARSTAGQVSKRAGSFVGAAAKAGVRASAADEQPSDVVITGTGTDVGAASGLTVRVSAEQDRDVLSPERMVAAVLTKARARA